jgi:hypothetical protein
MNHNLSIVMRSALLIVVTACTSGEDPVAGASAGGAPVVEGISPECERWARALGTCNSGDLGQLGEVCPNFGPCQAEAEAYWTCSADGLEKNCDISCPQYSGALDYCILTVATCEVHENSCSCVGETFKPDNTFVTCEVIDAEPAGGSGAGGDGGGGGGVGQIVQCQCGYGDTITHICQQEVLDCRIGNSCCWEF